MMFQEASMNLHEWISNDTVVNGCIPIIDQASCSAMKVFGHQWDIVSDTMSLNPMSVSLDVKGASKGSVLKAVASVFDPLGLMSPALIKGKLLLQELWEKKLEWEDELFENDKIKWSSVLNKMT